MSTRVQGRSRLAGGRVLSDGHVLYWWAELLAILVFYVAYSTVRNIHGGAQAPPHAFDHARQIISLERHLGIYHEETIQQWALHFRPLILFGNYFYGSFHFIVTIFAGIFLYRRYADDYPRFRNTLAITTAIALIGFTLYPLAPPRMFPGFVDTLLKDPAFWSFNSGGMQNVSNQYAAMPSVHIAWAIWCALALGPRLKNRTAATLAWCYPLITLVVIVITANHYILDAVAGVVILGIGWVAANRLTRAGRASSASGGREWPADRVA
ncbi:MAG: phosphatase PAP2 family protein [Actinomycetota bacterium]|nr:phosphatase PAP2 family protein [Actinomycetota bacterium]